MLEYMMFSQRYPESGRQMVVKFAFSMSPFSTAQNIQEEKSLTGKSRFPDQAISIYRTEKWDMILAISEKPCEGEFFGGKNSIGLIM